MQLAEVREGLEGVVVANSSMSWIDGENGVLIYQGYNIHDLAEKSTFEEVIFLLWNGRLPTQAEFDDYFKRLSDERQLNDQEWDFVRRYANSQVHPMAFLRTAVSFLAHSDPDVEDNSHEANVRKGFRLTGKMAVMVAAFDRIRNGKEPLQAKPEWNHAKNFLWMLKGREPDELEARAMDVALILHADHGFNASTFAARVTAATLSDLHSAITSAVGTLKGPLHGGANTRVMQMLLEIGEVERAEQWVLDALARKERIMGFGHRVYRTMDPRAVHLRELSKKLCERIGETKWYEMSEKIFEVVHREKGLWPNVDFFSASTYYAMGIPLDLYTPIFAMSRVVGWVGHCLEQYAHNRLIRPRANYVGPKGLQYVPIDQRT